MSDWQKMVTRHKGALTRAKNSGDQHKIIEVCDKALSDFDEYGYPDAWADWERAKEDANLKLNHNGYFVNNWGF